MLIVPKLRRQKDLVARYAAIPDSVTDGPLGSVPIQKISLCGSGALAAFVSLALTRVLCLHDGSRL